MIKTKNLMNTIFHFACLAFLSCIAGCDPYETPQIKITEPPRGSIFPASSSIGIKVVGDPTDLSQLLINRERQLPQSGQGSEQHTYLLPPSDGVGYVTASLPNDPYLVSRSWLQGEFVSSEDWYPDTLTIRFSYDTLNGEENSVAQLIEASLLETDLARFIPPIEIDLGISLASITILSARVRRVGLELLIEEDELELLIEIELLDLDYQFNSSLVNTDGTGRYERINVTSNTIVEPRGITLVNPALTLSPLRVEDNRIPQSLIDPIIDALKPEFERALTQAIIEATQTITGQLFTQLNPRLSLALPKPIEQETNLAGVYPLDRGLELQYQTRVNAVTSQVAQPHHGALFARPPKQLCRSEWSTIIVGTPLINQFAFSLWDAGNFQGLSFSRSRLQTLGLGELSFPYSNLTSAQVDLLLPPVMGWDEGGPYLDVGGLQVNMKIDLSKDTQAWTAARIPIHLALEEGALRLKPDPNRPITVRPIMLNRLNVVAERDEVLKLIKAALPGVVGDVFGRLPLVSLPPLDVFVLNEASHFSIVPQITGIIRQVDHWQIELNLWINQK